VLAVEQRSVQPRCGLQRPTAFGSGPDLKIEGTSTTHVFATSSLRSASHVAGGYAIIERIEQSRERCSRQRPKQLQQTRRGRDQDVPPEKGVHVHPGVISAEPCEI
jgi:hypothetical protein